MTALSRVFALGFVFGTLITTPVMAGTIVVTSTNSDGWTFSNADNSGTNASGGYEVGPDTPPAGTGSAEFTVGSANSSEVLYQIITPMSAANISALSYYTYMTTSTAGSGSEVNLEFDLYSGATYEGRLVYDPGLLLSTTYGSWNKLTPYTDDAWYFTRSSVGGCSISNSQSYCTLSQAVADLNTDPGSIMLTDIIFKAGSGQASFNGNVDDFTINNTTYDFEPAATVPEPADLAIFGSAFALLGGMAFYRRRKV